MLGERDRPNPGFRLPRLTAGDSLKFLSAGIGFSLLVGGYSILYRLAGKGLDNTSNPSSSVLVNPASNVVRLEIKDECFVPPGGRIKPYPSLELRPESPVQISQTLVTNVTKLETGETYTDAVASHTGGMGITPEAPYRMSSVADSVVPRVPFQPGSNYGVEIHDAGVGESISERTLKAAGNSAPIAPCD